MDKALKMAYCLGLSLVLGSIPGPILPGRLAGQAWHREKTNPVEVRP